MTCKDCIHREVCYLRENVPSESYADKCGYSHFEKDLETPKGDLISREALIKWIDDSVSQYGNTYSTDMLNMWGLFKDYLIDNAPTVAKDYDTGYQDGLEDGLNDIRPHGEWNYIQAGMCVCSFCGAYPHKDYKNFCAKCGADMRGKEE